MEHSDIIHRGGWKKDLKKSDQTNGLRRFLTNGMQHGQYLKYCV